MLEVVRRAAKAVGVLGSESVVFVIVEVRQKVRQQVVADASGCWMMFGNMVAAMLALIMYVAIVVDGSEYTLRYRYYPDIAW